MKITVVIMSLLFASISFAGGKLFSGRNTVIACGVIQISNNTTFGNSALSLPVVETYFNSEGIRFRLIDNGTLKRGAFSSLKDGQIVTIIGSAQENGYGELDLTPFGIEKGCN